jgi:hypothetical protein
MAVIPKVNCSYKAVNKACDSVGISASYFADYNKLSLHKLSEFIAWVFREIVITSYTFLNKIYNNSSIDVLSVELMSRVGKCRNLPLKLQSSLLKYKIQGIVVLASRHFSQHFVIRHL